MGGGTPHLSVCVQCESRGNVMDQWGGGTAPPRLPPSPRSDTPPPDTELALGWTVGERPAEMSSPPPPECELYWGAKGGYAGSPPTPSYSWDSPEALVGGAVAFGPHLMSSIPAPQWDAPTPWLGVNGGPQVPFPPALDRRDPLSLCQPLKWAWGGPGPPLLRGTAEGLPPSTHCCPSPGLSPSLSGGGAHMGVPLQGGGDALIPQL